MDFQHFPVPLKTVVLGNDSEEYILAVGIYKLRL